MKAKFNDVSNISADADNSESHTEQAYKYLKNLIVTMALPPGASISEATLSTKTGFGRMPVRMALKFLEHDGLITCLPRKGAFIRQMKAEDELANIEIRRPVERMLACKTARMATRAQRESLCFFANCMVQAAMAGDVQQFLHFDRECDQVILEAANNVFVGNIVGLLYAHSERFWAAHSKAADMVTVAKHHKDIMDAIADGDEERTAREMDILMDYREHFCKMVTGFA